MARLDFTVPTGGAATFAGARGPVFAPSAVASLRAGPVYASALLGARIREPVEFGGVRLGTQLVTMLGVGVSALPRGELDLSLESWLAPSLVSESGTFSNGRYDGRLFPAEWMASARTRIDRVTIAVGGGGALPLSSETNTNLDGSSSTDHFAGLTTPRFRAALVVRYQTDTTR
jgi:hypothetical protein